MAGVILVLLGILKLGVVIKFIPYPVIVGFTSGIAVTIFTTQIADVFGLQFGAEKVPGDFTGKWLLYFRHFDSINWWNTVVAMASIAIIALSPRFLKKIPGSLIAIVFITGMVYLLRTFAGVDAIDTIGDRFTIKSQLPDAEIPSLSWKTIQGLFPVAVTIAVLGAIESLLSATVADGMISDKHDSNTELIAQGAANMITPLFGGIPATGAIARTMTNINNGGRTPVAGIIHTVVLLLILLFFMPLAQYIPMACLAGVLVIVSYNMSEWRTFKALLRNSKSDVTVLLLTFFLTVIFDLTIAIERGLIIACLLFMRRVMETTEISVITDEINPSAELDFSVHEENLIIPPGVEVYEISGPYFFGVANKFDEYIAQLKNPSEVRIIRMRRVPFIDSTGIHNLTNLCRRSQKEKITVILSGVNSKVHDTLAQANFYTLLGEENICPHINVALERAKEVLKKKKIRKSSAKQ
jgi:SulP family sulfate permease